jgi:hypothetical protein
VTRPLLLHAPTISELSRLYHELAQLGATSVGERTDWPYAPENAEELLVLAAEMMRYDARLLDVLVQWLCADYRRFNPLRVRQEMRKMRWPQSLLVALEFAKLASSDQELHLFADYLSQGWSRIDPAERFFLETERPGTRRAARSLGRNLAPYARWGFLGQDRPVVDPVSKRTVGRYDSSTRRRILNDLLERNGELTMADYLSALDYSITRQQARKDFQTHDLRASGHGPGAVWRKKSSRKRSSTSSTTNSPRSEE